MAQTPAEKVGERIRTLREAHGLTQGALAQSTCVTQSAVSQWERGVTMPALPVQFFIADALRTRRSWLFRELDTEDAA